MKKRKFGYKLSRGKGARKALFKGLTRSLVEYGSIETTYTKAKAVRPEVEKLVKLATKQDLASRRKVYARLGNDRKTTDKLFSEVAKSFKDKTSGFTKITQLGVRRGDAGRMARIEWSVKLAQPKETKEKAAKKQVKEEKKGMKRITSRLRKSKTDKK